jgi:hypothetical protein
VLTRINRQLWPWRIAGTAVVLAGLLACGFVPSASEDAPPATAEDEASLPDPCQLLTPEEIGAVRGGPTDAGVPGTGQPRGHRACTFGQHDDGRTTAITVFAGDQARFVEERYVVAQNFDVEDIPGLGDAAFIGATVLHVRQGGLIITLFTGSPYENEQRDHALALAPKALARL